MTVALKLRQALNVNENIILGAELTDQTVSLTSGKSAIVQDVTIADNYGTAILWTTGDNGFTTFTHGFILSDQDVWVELRNDDSGTPEFIVFEVKANILTAIPAKSGGGTSERLDGAALVDNTDYADVDRIEVQRDAAEAAGDANVSIALFG